MQRTARHHAVIAAAAAACLLGVAAPAAAHDMFIKPSKFTVDAPAPLVIDLLLGHDGKHERYRRDQARIVRFDATSATAPATVGITGQDGLVPAGHVNALTPGLHILAYQAKPATITMPFAKFRRYLKTEGDDRAIKALDALPKDQRGDQREFYQRSLTSLVRVGADAAYPDKPVASGIALEIVPLSDPFAAKGSLRFALYHDGKPSVGAKVRAYRMDNKGKTLVARTDAKGEVRFRLARGKAWILASVHIDRQPNGSWLSTWTSLTFER